MSVHHFLRRSESHFLLGSRGDDSHGFPGLRPARPVAATAQHVRGSGVMAMLQAHGHVGRGLCGQHFWFLDFLAIQIIRL